MRKLLDKILIIDVESTCWEKQIPIGMENEIIEIGACLLNIRTGEIIENRGIFVIPVRSKISSFCTQLTSITSEIIVAEGVKFKVACEILVDNYQSKSRVWASYGAYDLNQFKKQCAATDVEYPFGQSHVNVKTLFALKHKLKQEEGMEKALARIQLPLDGTHHRGVDDARNIAKILHWCLT